MIFLQIQSHTLNIKGCFLLIYRTIEQQIKTALQHYPVVILTGSKQSGKTTEVYKLREEFNFRYVSLEHISKRKAALEDPEFFIQQYGYPLIIDEIQYAPVLMEVIEAIVNRKRLEEGSANGCFILTGSQTFVMMKGVTQSLAGRACILHMTPLSYSEIMEKEERPFFPRMDFLHVKHTPIQVKQLYQKIVRGFYPELYKDKESDANLYYENYVNTYIDRDVTELIQVKNKLSFHNFLQHIATLTAQQINYSDIARIIGVDAKTIKSWISILEASAIIYLLQPYSENKLTKRIVKAPKLYFSDTGLAAHLARVHHPEYLMVSNLAGAFMETYVMNEIKKSYENNALPFHGYYYRDNQQNEIDLILLENQTLHCIEIKKGSLFDKKHIKSFEVLENSQYQMGVSCIVCNCEQSYAINRNTLVLPVGCIGR